MRSLNFHLFLYRSIVLFAFALLILFFYKSKAADNNSSYSYGKTMIFFSQTSKGNINVQVKALKTKNVELYIFNTSGELVHKLVTDTKSINTLQGMHKGQYLYQCFEKDIELKSGKLNINQNNINYD